MNKKAITIIEVLVAMVLLGIALATIIPSFINYSGLNRDAEVRAGAATAATQVMDRLRQENFTNWSTVGTAVTGSSTGQRSLTIDTGIRTYTVVITPCTNRCNGSSRDPRVSVSFNNKEYYTVSTVFVVFG
jgi:type II secretory pathway pseudopilin PulG